MSNVIDFLEQIGRDASLHDRARHELEGLLADAGVDPALRDALVKGESSSLERLLGAKTDMCCLIHVPDGGDEEGFGANIQALDPVHAPDPERELALC